jgi:predicted metal-dependent HD superfamily phosphohydrolase
MAVYLDPPLWPAHETLFSHLISDTSLAELHAFAAAAGIPERAFDGDHYDVPQRRYDDLVAAGAIPVEARVLVRKLIASGLRIPARSRTKSLKTPLLNRWNDVMPGHDALFLDLLDRWSESHRRYHGCTHLLAVLEALDLLTAPPPGRRAPCCWRPGSTTPSTAESPARTRRNRPGSPSSGSAAPAFLKPTSKRWRGWSGSRRITGREPGDDDGALLCDADLSVLGGEPEPYARYVAAVREDYAHIGDADFAAGRAAVVRQLLSLDPLFHTERARKLWLDAARRNLQGELA